MKDIPADADGALATSVQSFARTATSASFHEPGNQRDSMTDNPADADDARPARW